MTSYRLSWAIMGPDRSIETSQRGTKEEATLEESMERVDTVLAGAGIVELVAVSPAEVGPRGLQIRSEGGRSIITLAEVDTEGENNIRTYRSESEGDEVEILGNRWRRQLVCEDRSTVRQAVSQLFATGTVSNELLT